MHESQREVLAVLSKILFEYEILDDPASDVHLPRSVVNYKDITIPQYFKL